MVEGGMELVDFNQFLLKLILIRLPENHLRIVMRICWSFMDVVYFYMP